MQELRSLMLVDCRETAGQEYIVTVETHLGHIPNPTDVVYVKERV